MRFLATSLGLIRFANHLNYLSVDRDYLVRVTNSSVVGQSSLVRELNRGPRVARERESVGRNVRQIWFCPSPVVPSSPMGDVGFAPRLTGNIINPQPGTAALVHGSPAGIGYNQAKSS
ncbi:hypothetical protein QLX08_001174 [Tetragonisca angustula]|uniref:Uncharacterized protein n=1 Tax=Tetragonisca angustula TaxID=166442 RepID=A0AAW1AK38_9HYME